MSGGLSKRNDVDTSPSLRVYDRNGYAVKQAQRDDALFLVTKPVILERVGGTFEYALWVDEIQTMFLEIPRAL